MAILNVNENTIKFGQSIGKLGKFWLGIYKDALNRWREDITQFSNGS